MFLLPVLFKQENVKYLPGIKLGKNVVADPDLENAGSPLSNPNSMMNLYIGQNPKKVFFFGWCCSEGCKHVGVCDPTSIHGGNL